MSLYPLLPTPTLSTLTPQLPINTSTISIPPYIYPTTTGTNTPKSPTDFPTSSYRTSTPALRLTTSPTGTSYPIIRTITPGTLEFVRDFEPFGGEYVGKLEIDYPLRMDPLSSGRVGVIISIPEIVRVIEYLAINKFVVIEGAVEALPNYASDQVNIVVGENMRLELTSPTLLIQPETREQQMLEINPGGYAQWQWSVTAPNEDSIHLLNLKVYLTSFGEELSWIGTYEVVVIDKPTPTVSELIVDEPGVGALPNLTRTLILTETEITTTTPTSTSTSIPTSTSTLTPTPTNSITPTSTPSSTPTITENEEFFQNMKKEPSSTILLFVTIILILVGVLYFISLSFLYFRDEDRLAALGKELELMGERKVGLENKKNTLQKHEDTKPDELNALKKDIESTKKEIEECKFRISKIKKVRWWQYWKKDHPLFRINPFVK